mgnify:CR=1 FL=1
MRYDISKPTPPAMPTLGRGINIGDNKGQLASLVETGSP